ncbi:alpha/beta fold hydrolase [Kribbella sp. VKM Ac-2566]|uniref:alpha/beta fold hydrolase n=1 Tax=Kribbella sp. VKM Ac-2566 TaxID=2512218 RepID=UPI0010640DF8|nr:alpha/beta hydrolase [Kribbella sp. VKM Ac-2566]TDX08291.1 pimeloyl-ACP methyl ester carboxylesterase [Kribbella sp. VKM Ac-2566]
MDTVVSKDGTVIAYDKSGNGPALITVIGALNQRSDDFNVALAALLAERFTVYNYDRRGRGDSTDTPPYAVQREVEDIAALVEAAGGSACIYGTSSGGILALEASRQLDSLTKVAMYEPPCIIDDTRPARPADYVRQLNTMVADNRRGDAVAYFMTVAAGVPAEYVSGMRTQPFWARLESLAHTIAYDGLVMGNTMSGNPLPTEWANVKTPTLIADGGQTLAFQTAAMALADLLPNGEHRTLPDQPHNVDPEAITPVLIDYFTA